MPKAKSQPSPAAENLKWEKCMKLYKEYTSLKSKNEAMSTDLNVLEQMMQSRGTKTAISKANVIKAAKVVQTKTNQNLDITPKTSAEILQQTRSIVENICSREPMEILSQPTNIIKTSSKRIQKSLKVAKPGQKFPKLDQSKKKVNEILNSLLTPVKKIEQAKNLVSGILDSLQTNDSLEKKLLQNIKKKVKSQVEEAKVDKFGSYISYNNQTVPEEEHQMQGLTGVITQKDSPAPVFALLKSDIIQRLETQQILQSLCQQQFKQEINSSIASNSSTASKKYAFGKKHPIYSASRYDQQIKKHQYFKDGVMTRSKKKVLLRKEVKEKRSVKLQNILYTLALQPQ